MQYAVPLAEFPTQIMASHMVASRYFPFYSTFSPIQKYEWLAWTSTVMFQTVFTISYLYFDISPETLGLYFFGHIAYDTAFLFFYCNDALMYIHHAVSMAVCAGMYLFGGGVIGQVADAVAFLECSNILLGTVWLLNRAGYGKTWILKTLGAVALVTYVTLRAYLFPRYLILFASRPVAMMLAIFVPMNMVWCWKLIGYYAHIAFTKKAGGVRLE